jgi:DNA-binding transcriptional MerR regulator
MSESEKTSSKSGGTKIAQAAKDLNVTTVTIRRYLSEFDIATTSDDNGIKVLPDQSMKELLEVRRLKDEGMNNPQVMELLLGMREKQPPSKIKTTRAKVIKAEAQDDLPIEIEDEESEKIEDSQAEEQAPRRKVSAKAAKQADLASLDEEGEKAEGEEEAQSSDIAGKAKHSLTCQTCGKVFEHMNPRLRDCLDCYRSKRKERRRGGSDKHKTVIQHPIAQQAASKSPGKSQVAAQQNGAALPQAEAPGQAVAPVRSHGVRNYRKAIEETRHITTNLKRRLERPDLPEGDRRWLEQIYAYQLILHQGWRHLSEYKQGGQSGGHSKSEGKSESRSATKVEAKPETETEAEVTT